MVSGNRVTIRGLKEDKRYMIRVEAVNEVGRGKFAQTVKAIRTRRAPSSSVYLSISTL